MDREDGDRGSPRPTPDRAARHADKRWYRQGWFFASIAFVVVLALGVTTARLTGFQLTISKTDQSAPATTVAPTSTSPATTATAPAPTSSAPTAAAPAVNQAALQKGIADRFTDFESVGDCLKVARAMKRNDVDQVRQDVEWRFSEKQPGLFDFSDFDKAFECFRLAKLEAVAMPDYAPSHAAVPGNCADVICAPSGTPQSVLRFRAYCQALSSHYAGPRFRVKTFEVWNEENIARYWPRPNPGTYAKYLKACSQGLRAGNHNAEIWFGGVTVDGSGPGDLLPLDFVKAVYGKLGIKCGSSKASHQIFSGVAVHPYTQGSPKGSSEFDGWGQMEAIRRFMDSRCDQKKKIIPTEFGYSAADGTEAEEKQNFKDAWALWKAMKGPKGPFFWHVWRDGGEETFGLITKSGRKRQVFNAFVQAS